MEQNKSERLNIPKSKWEVELGEKDKFAKVKIGKRNLDLKSLELTAKDFKLENSIAILIADAGTTYNVCNQLPSELLSQNKEMLECLKLITESSTGEEFKKHRKEAQQLIQKLTAKP